MKLYTCQMAKWRVAINFLDTTVKSGDKLFAPTWELLNRYRNDIITSDEYEVEFITLMRKSFKDNREHWLTILSSDVLTIGCYCKAHGFCHRYILVKLFKSVCEIHNIPFEYMGELE